MAKIGSCWKNESWADTAWAANTWENVATAAAKKGGGGSSRLRDKYKKAEPLRPSPPEAVVATVEAPPEPKRARKRVGTPTQLPEAPTAAPLPEVPNLSPVVDSTTAQVDRLLGVPVEAEKYQRAIEERRAQEAVAAAELAARVEAERLRQAQEDDDEEAILMLLSSL